MSENNKNNAGSRKEDKNWRTSRFSVLGAWTSLIAVLLSFLIIYQTGVIGGINTKADEDREMVRLRTAMKTSVEGTIFDRNGCALTAYRGESKDKTGQAFRVLYPEEFSYIIGYRKAEGVATGLRAWYADELFDLNEKYKDRIGGNITLTIDLGLQQAASKLLRGHVGSINVIDADTGEILCMAARGDETFNYDVNKVFRGEEGYYEKCESIDAFFYNRSTFENDPPGSTMKLITTIGILENKDVEQKYVVEDPYVTPSGKEIENYDKSLDGKQCNLQQALDHSLNTYFATRGLMIGADEYTKLAKRFLIGEDIHLDFCDLNKSNFNVYGDDPIHLLASAAYGQGQTVISPLHMAMIMSGVINNDRNMLKPYLISSITNEGKTVQTGETSVLSKRVIKSDRVQKELKKLLHNTAVNAYGFSNGSERSNADYGYIIAKSGTAEIPGSKNHAYLLVGYTFRGRNFAICIDFTNLPEKSFFGVELAPYAEKLIEYINLSYFGVR